MNSGFYFQIDSTDFWLVSDMNANRTVVPSLDTDTNLLSIGWYLIVSLCWYRMPNRQVPKLKQNLTHCVRLNSLTARGPILSTSATQMMCFTRMVHLYYCTLSPATQTGTTLAEIHFILSSKNYM